MCVTGLKEKRVTYVGPLQKGWFKETWRLQSVKTVHSITNYLGITLIGPSQRN